MLLSDSCPSFGDVVNLGVGGHRTNLGLRRVTLVLLVISIPTLRDWGTLRRISSRSLCFSMGSGCWCTEKDSLEGLEIQSAVGFEGHNLPLGRVQAGAKPH